MPPFNELADLPPKLELESVEMLKLTLNANRFLAELKGYPPKSQFIIKHNCTPGK